MNGIKGIIPLQLAANQITEVIDIPGPAVQFKLYSATDVDGLLIKINGGSWEAIIATHTAIPAEGILTVQFRDISGLPNLVRWAVYKYKIADNLTEVNSVVLDAILDNAQGDVVAQGYGQIAISDVTANYTIQANTDRKGFSIQAMEGNTGKIYVGFDNTVTAAKSFAELQVGQPAGLDNYRGDIYVISSVAGDKICWGEW